MVQQFDVSKLDAVGVRRTGKKKVSRREEEDISWEEVFALSRFFPYKEEHVPERRIGDPMDLETVEGATKDEMVNIVRRAGLEVMKPGQCVLASDLCRAVAERMIKVKYQRKEVIIEDVQQYKRLVRSLTGVLVQKVSNGNIGLTARWDPLMCVQRGGRWVIMRKW